MTSAGPAVILVGPPGSGKSTVGPVLAALLGMTFLDTDDEVAVAAGKPAEDIFIEDGEAAFRALERAAAQRALASHDGVLALGSGAVLDSDIRDLVAGRPVVYLETSFGQVARRAGLDRPRPPLPGNPRARLRALLDERLALYAGVARLTVPTDDLGPEEIAAEIAAAGIAAERKP